MGEDGLDVALFDTGAADPVGCLPFVLTGVRVADRQVASRKRLVSG